MDFNIDPQALVKYGAYGISIALIAYTAWQNSSLIGKAGKLTPEMAKSLGNQIHRSTLICLGVLVTAGALDIGTRWLLESRPVTVNVQLTPDDFATKARLLPEMAQFDDPVLRMRILGDGDPTDYLFKEGVFKATLSKGQTLSFDIVKVSDALLIASQRNVAANDFMATQCDLGASEPEEL